MGVLYCPEETLGELVSRAQSSSPALGSGADLPTHYRPSGPATQGVLRGTLPDLAALAREIADREDLKQRVEASLHGGQRVQGAAENRAANAANSSSSGLRELWSKRRLQVCDVVLVLGGATFCTKVIGIDGNLAVVVLGLLVGGGTIVKTAVNAIKMTWAGKS